MMTFRAVKGRGVFRLMAGAGWLLLSIFPAAAQFDPSKAYKESAAVTARFAEPAARYDTPAFAANKPDFTSQDEMMAFLEMLARNSTLLRLEREGRSQQGREIPVAVLSRSHAQVGSGARPVLLIIGQQHGNEPAGGEAALALAQMLGGGPLAGLLDAVDVVIAPRANPDGAAAFVRGLADGIDANRDHTLLRTPEARVLAGLFARFKPSVVLDCHEFTVGGRWLTKVGGLTRVDAMLQHATVPNLAPSLRSAAIERVLPAMRLALEAQGLSHDWYFTTDGARADAPVAMGGIGPDTGRNIAGLRNALSFLIETRGVGIGKSNYARRVHTHVVAAESILRLLASDPQGFLALSRRAEAESAAAQGPLVVSARQEAQTRALTFIDPVTGADRPVSVNWLSSLQIEPVMTRTRPAGYLLSASQTAAIAALARAGVTTRIIAGGKAVPGQRYRAAKLTSAAKADVRGDDTGAGEIVNGTYVLEDELVQPSDGDVFVALDQPLAALVAVLMEPESTVGLVANRLIGVQEGQLLPFARLMGVP